MSTPRPARPLLARVVRGVRVHAVCSPLTTPAERARVVAKLAQG